jgi:streptomycin 6-kinase
VSSAGQDAATVRDVELPDVVRAKAEQAGAGPWVAGLPGLVADLERNWGITVGRAYPDPTEAYVAEAELADGTPAVLKLLVPRPGDAADEITVLRLADGAGCVRLLASDADRGALLLDRLGPSLHALRVPLGRRLEIMCDLAARLWRPAPDAGLPTGAEKGRWLVDHILRMWSDLGAPCSRAALDHALVCADRRIAAYAAERAVLVHGDVHQAGDGGWVGTEHPADPRRRVRPRRPGRPAGCGRAPDASMVAILAQYGSMATLLAFRAAWCDRFAWSGG